MQIDPTLYLMDSNILISYFIQDAYQKRIAEFLTNGCYINHVVFHETLNFLHNKYSPFRSLQAAKIMLTHPHVFIFLDIEPEAEHAAAMIMEQFLDNGLSFVDCVLLAQAEQYRVAGVYTMDKKMQNYRRVRVVNPIET